MLIADVFVCTPGAFFYAFFTPTGICRIHAFEAFIFFTYEMALYANEGRLYGV